MIKELLSENSPLSTTRVMSLVSLFVGAGIGIYGIYRGTDLSGTAQICAVFVSSAFLGKVSQKFTEKKETINVE